MRTSAVHATHLTRDDIALPGAAHDVTAARTGGLVDAVRTFADKGTKARAARRTRGIAIVPGCRVGGGTSTAAPPRIRAIGERAVATLKDWKVLTKLRCCPIQGRRQHGRRLLGLALNRATALVRAILVLQLVEEGRRSG